MVYQPIVQAIGSNQFQCNEYEVLLHSKDDDKFPIDEFNIINSSEDSNLIFMEWYAEQLIPQIKEHKNSNFSVNINPDQWEQPSTVCFLQKLSQYANRITIELTEHVPKSSCSIDFTKILKNVKKLGFGIALDDITVGNNTTQFFSKHADKIDRIKFSLLDNSIETIQNIDSIVELAKKFDKQLVVEKIEDLRTANCLKKRGVCRFQGFLFGKGTIKPGLGNTNNEQFDFSML